ncbi:MAG: M56 family metallopeptidase [Bacteroidota bacterium]
MNFVTYLDLSDWTALLAAVAVKGTLLFLATFFVVGLLRRTSAATRHAVWTLALAAALVLPALFLVLPGWQVPVLPASDSGAFVTPIPPAPAAAPAAPLSLLAPPLPPSPPSAPRVLVIPRPDASSRPDAEAQSDLQVHVHHDGTRARSVVIERREAAASAAAAPLMGHSPSSPLPLDDWRSWVLLAWVAGTVVVAARWFIAMLGAWQLVQRAEPVHDPEWLELKERIAFGLGLERPVRLLRSDRITVPVACGVSTPVVLLPAGADAWSEDRREVVLTHELAHILRRDCLSQLVAQAALVVHWFNPLAWAAHRRFLLEREHACDDYVINNGARASDYADHLMSIARRFRRDSLSLSATAPMARRSNLEGRILSILDADQNRSAASRVGLAVCGALALALILPLAAFHPVEAEPDLQAVLLAPDVAEPTPAPEPEVLVIASSTRDDTVTWEGRVASGGSVEVYGINGSIQARTGAGDRVRIEAEKKSRRGREDEVEIVVNEFANGVVVCAVYPGQDGRCRPGEGAGDGDIRDSDVNVQFEITLPESVRLVAQTVNGSVKTEPLGADVEVRTVNGSLETASRRGDVTAETVNGSVRAEAAGLVRAGTVNGSLTLRMGRADWDGTLAFETVNGSITLDVPDDFSATVRAEAQTGSIKSDFPLEIRRDGYTGASAKGQVGSASRRLTLSVLNGSIKLRRGSGAIGAATGADAARDRHQRLNERRARIEEQWLNDRRVQEERHRDLAFQALADIGPEMERAMEEAERALAAVDFEGAIASALAGIDRVDIQREVEAALAEIDWAWESADWDEVWQEAEDGLRDELDDLRDELDDLEEELAEDELTLAERQELQVLCEALRAEERALKRYLREMRHREASGRHGAADH